MIPLVSTEAEIKIMKDLVIRIASEVQKEHKLRPPKHINCGIYTMKCSIDYNKLYEKMTIVLSNYN